MKILQSLWSRWLLIGFVSLLTACSQHVELFSGLQESDGNEVLSALLQAGIHAEKVMRKDGVTIQVPAEMSSKALQTLQAQGLPRHKQDGMGEVFKKENLISSPLEERARYLYALSQEIEKTLTTIDGVIAARVHIVLPERLAPGEPMLPSSAAVFIKHREDVDFQLYIPKVRNLVFNSIPGLSGDEREKVTIVALPALKRDAPAIQLKWIGPVAVEASSVASFNICLAIIIGVWALSLFGMYTWFKNPLWLKKVKRA